MKKCLAVIACGLLAVLALAACGAKDDSSAQNTLEASLVALSGDLLTVQGTDGSELVFSVKGVEIENAEAYKAGDAVTITYTGEVKGTDTNRAVVVSVQNPAAESAQSAAQPEEKKLTGTLVDATMNAITLAVDKEEYVFATEGAEMKVLDGLVVGNTIEVTYTGELNGTDTSGITVVRIVDGAVNTVEQAASSSQAQSNVKITETNESVWATAGLNVRSGPDTDYKRIGGVKTGAEVKRTGVTDNGWSRILYDGKEAYAYSEYLTTKQPAAPAATPAPGTSAPAPSPAPTPAPHPEHTYAEISGTVVDASMSTITIDTGAGSYTFNIEGAAHDYKNGLAVGNWVTIQFTGALNGTDTSGVTVLCVTDLDDNASPAGAWAGIGAGAQPENEIGTGAGTGGIGNGVTVG